MLCIIAWSVKKTFYVKISDKNWLEWYVFHSKVLNKVLMEPGLDFLGVEPLSMTSSDTFFA